MARRRYISSEISVDSKLNRVSDFAALFYTWGLAHARDDCVLPATISGKNKKALITAENAEELLYRVVPGRKKAVADVEEALKQLIAVGLLEVDENGEIFYPPKSFYKYQTYVTEGNRRRFAPILAENAASVSSSVSSSVSGSYQNKNPISASPGRSKRNDSDSEDHSKEVSPMGKSMGLIPELKAAADAVYLSDPIKFKRLAAWIGQGRKHGWTEPDMAETLRRFWDYRAIDEWYSYLDSILERVVKDRNIAESDREHEKNKRELKEWGDNARNGDDALSRMIRELSDGKKI